MRFDRIDDRISDRTERERKKETKKETKKKDSRWKQKERYSALERMNIPIEV